ncbi:MAG: metallopeptidase family protein [Polyangiaceae bacterium]
MKFAGTFTLPSGRRVTIAIDDDRGPRKRRRGAPLFSEVHDVFADEDTANRLSEHDATLAVDALALRDFHVLRAILMHARVIHEEPIAFPCKNCGSTIRVAPCSAIELGPFRDSELHDPELDVTLPFGVETASGAVFSPISVADAAPLHRALRRRTLRFSPRVVRAMGLSSVAGRTGASSLATWLESCDDLAFAAVTDAFLATHYAPRSFARVPCAECPARNDVDAPYEREFEPGSGRDASANDSVPFVGFTEFADVATRLAEELVQPYGDEVAFLVEDDVPACDEGGEPLLGSYVPAYAGDPTTPSHQAEVTVYYRTFRATWDDDGPFDWEAELRETIEHELDHHDAHLAGDDPVDDEERRVIAEEASRLVGERALARRQLGGFGADVLTFFRRTWPLWLLVVVATLVSMMAGGNQD